MFFGRESELRTLSVDLPRNYLVVGSRQMGKTSLLKALERLAQMRHDVNVQFVTLTSGDLPGELASRLNRPRPQSATELYTLCAGTIDHPRLWLLDEADVLVQSNLDPQQDWWRTLRALSQEKLAYFVLSGFWQLHAAARLDSQHPLRNFGNILRLGPLYRDAGRALVTRPMAALQLSYASDSLVERILDETGLHPNLLAQVCSGLIETLDLGQRVFTVDQLEKVFARYIPLRHSLQALDGRGAQVESALDRAVVGAALLCAVNGLEPNLQEIQDKLMQYGKSIPAPVLRASLQRQELAYVLIPSNDRRYTCPIPLLRRFIAEAGERPLAARLQEDLEEVS
jgi:hypothetical protein